MAVREVKCGAHQKDVGIDSPNGTTDAPEKSHDESMFSGQTINSEQHLLHKRCSQHLKQNHGLNMLKKIKPSPVKGKSSYK